MIQLVKGTKDIYGAEVKAWQEIEAKMRRICETFGIGEIRTPMFEFTELSAPEYAISLGLAFLIIPIVEIIKAIQRAFTKKKSK